MFFCGRREQVKPYSRRQTPQSVHLDADEISAFAENALPEKAKQIYTWRIWRIAILAANLCLD